ncbi:MxaD family protein [Alteromonas mediterranea]|uniref:SRPBCC family protein n=1 Tax=Alteromonas mediterranea TaxID=314275 RepID=UPI0009034DC3|nr:SRPBCC family protein [Alteromonas mediterranea]APD94892.1 MxaD family protein [Alteromonas mediterranea]APD98527.1 MxaD family protein [Alteromonas mediterranea]QGX62669.1 SRPBCC family protein [Alteromonas mediterranea]
MFSIHVERTINKPIEEVFSILSDHANYAQFKAIEQSNLRIKGKHETNGLGAVREIISGGSNLHEEIVAYEPPYKLGYKVVKSTPLPYNHQLGEITLKDKDGKTHVTWRSQGHITIFLLGSLYFDKQIQSVGSRAFGSILKQIDNMA